MADVFRFFRQRPPRGAALQSVVARGIFTHGAALAVGTTGMSHPATDLPFVAALTGTVLASAPSVSTGTAQAASFSETLRAAYEASDLDRFIQVAADFYRTSAIASLSDLHPVARAAYLLFDGMGPIIRKVPIDRALSQLGPAQVVDYLQQRLASDVARVNDLILAMEALRLHGSHRGVIPTRLLKALYGLAMAHHLRAQNPEYWPVAPLVTLFRMQVFVPGWVWKLDPCARLTPDRPELADSPLIEKRRAVALYREALARPANPNLCHCTCDDSCVPQSPCCAELTSFITDLFVVRQTLRCYVPSDIAYIENVLGGERRTREHETLTQIELRQETETTVTGSEERDHQVSERFELSSEVSRTVEEDTTVDAGVTFNQKWGSALAGGSVGTSLNVSHGSSISASDQVAQNHARDVVDRSVSKIERKVRQLASRSVLSRTREVNTHVFDRSEQDLTVGIYTWVSKTVTAQVFGYGQRMIYELVLPDPAASYKILLNRAFGLEETFKGGNPPTAPPSASNITPKNYLTLADAYGVDSPPTPPDLTRTLMHGFDGHYFNAYQEYGWFGGWIYSGMNSQNFTLTVPTDYEATSMLGTMKGRDWNQQTSVASVVVHIGGPYLQWAINGPDIPGPVALANLTGQLQVRVDAYNLTWFDAELTVQCSIKPAVYQAWQSVVHRALVEGYQKQKDAYDAALVAFQAAQAEKKKALEDFIRNRDPFVNREIERTELKRLAISWLSCQHFDRFNAMKRRVEPCGLPQMNLREAAEQAEIIGFWERALDWNLMMYLFYPYFWSAKCAWAEKIAEDTGDGLFDKFMQAGAARVQIPVTENFEDYLLYWESTGQIWGPDGEPPISDSDAHWVSMAEEIKHQQDCYQNDREGRVETNPPSDIVVIQGSDRYWDPVLMAVDDNAIALDLDREIVIDTVIYRIVAIAPDPNSPGYDVLHPDSMWWDVTLDRPYEGATAKGLPYAVGAKFVGAPWMVTIPTNLVWLKNDQYCLPCYPLKECASH
jgi:hypothetical protein